MPITPTMPYDMVKIVQYIEEVTTGTVPPSGTFVIIAPVALFSLASDKGAVPIFTLGARDPNAVLEGRRISGFSLRFHPLNSTFMKYAYNLGGGQGNPTTGTIDKSLSIYAQVLIGGTTYHFTAVFARIASMTTASAPGSPLMVDCYVTCQNPTLSTTTPGPTVVSLSGTPLMFYSGGVNPVTWGANNLNATAVAVRVNNNLIPMWVMGNKEYQALQPGARDFQAHFTNILTSTALITDYLAFTGQTFTWTIDSTGPKTFTITGGQLVNLRQLNFDVADLSATGRFGRGGGPVDETYMVFGTSIALT